MTCHAHCHGCQRHEPTGSSAAPVAKARVQLCWLPQTIAIAPVPKLRWGLSQETTTVWHAVIEAASLCMASTATIMDWQPWSISLAWRRSKWPFPVECLNVPESRLRLTAHWPLSLVKPSICHIQNLPNTPMHQIEALLKNFHLCIDVLFKHPTMACFRHRFWHKEKLLSGC